ncbi:MAG: hypothetical protein EA425_10530 [Puniceicoccaceae bacterium]|nr:MAG: hypothetical protein EA425_10530 [Puniceicoccaceae bacterium]
MEHPTQIFLHNPKALRVEFRLDDGRLILWWSPGAGQSFDARDRNFSNREDHLTVFESVTLPECTKERFRGCRYDPYHTVLEFEGRTLHLALAVDRPAVLLWAEQGLTVDLKVGRYDPVLEAAGDVLAVAHAEPAHRFVFAAALEAGAGAMRHSPFRGSWSAHYTRAELAAGQPIALGVGLEAENPLAACRDLVARTPAEVMAAINAALVPVERMGRVSSPAHPEMETLRRLVVRGLHSMIDESGAYRASLKAIYYLIWVRDAGFSFAYQSAAGWPHRLEELCRLLLANPATARGEGLPEGRLFAQLINPDYGKYEEDGLYYVVWTLFTHWTQTGEKTFFEGAHRELLEEALRWVERYCFDEARGLFGGYFADETPAYGSRDYGWDYAIGQPAGDEHIRHEGRAVRRSYDLYLNTLMHSCYTMLAAACGGSAGAVWEAKASGLWERLRTLYSRQQDGLPVYGDLLMEDGTLAEARLWGPARSVYVWALTMPNFLPLDGRDLMLGRLLDAIMEQPALHWINGICSAVAAADPWFAGEERLLEILLRVKDEAMKPGPYLPMGGAMPEKFDAPQGNLYHDIRPQGFAMGAWLAAWTSLGLRRLPYGLALRPVRAFERIEAYPWRGRTLTVDFASAGRDPLLMVNGAPCRGTLQIPEGRLPEGESHLVLAEGGGGPLWLRSTVRLLEVATDGPDGMVYRVEGFGLSEVTFAEAAGPFVLRGADRKEIPLERHQEDDACHLRFHLRGVAELLVGN